MTVTAATDIPLRDTVTVVPVTVTEANRVTGMAASRATGMAANRATGMAASRAMDMAGSRAMDMAANQAMVLSRVMVPQETTTAHVERYRFLIPYYSN